MATFISLLGFTDQGIRNVKQTTERAEAFKAVAKKLSVKVQGIYWTLGLYDVVIVMDAPDDETATSLIMSLGALGNVRTHTLRAFSAEEMSRIIKKMA